MAKPGCEAQQNGYQVNGTAYLEVASFESVLAPGKVRGRTKSIHFFKEIEKLMRNI